MTPLSWGPQISAQSFAPIRRRMVLDFCKWDPQVEDVPVLHRAPLLLQREAWQELCDWSEQLYRETLAAEQELLLRPDLLGQLGLPRPVTRLLPRCSGQPSPGIVRVMRFDFHWTTAGWRVSEVNSDVPGGFIEASPFTRLMAEATGCGVPCGDPASLYADCLARSVTGCVGLVHATAYSDDRQVMTYLAGLLQARGAATHLVSPADVAWREETPMLIRPDHPVPPAALVRFFPGEWLPTLGRRSGWQRFFGGSPVPLSNPAWALLSQTKRWPLVWHELKTPLPAWRALLPETRDPREVHWVSDPEWLVKPALGRVGDSVGIRGLTPAKDWHAITRSVRWWPRHWIAQRRFESHAIDSPAGACHAAIGVYVIDGQIGGVYGRVASRALIDHAAQDVAVLLPEPVGAGAGAKADCPREVEVR